LATPQNAALQGTSAVLNDYAKQIADSIRKTALRPGACRKAVLLYVTQTIDLDKARRGESTLSQENPNQPIQP